MNKLDCDVCGYTAKPPTVQEFDDGIKRCVVCVRRAHAPGEKYVSEKMALSLERQGVMPEFLRLDDPLRGKDGPLD